LTSFVFLVETPPQAVSAGALPAGAPVQVFSRTTAVRAVAGPHHMGANLAGYFTIAIALHRSLQ
jgi:hypothetical protein